jgi:hypothetical protein
VAARGLVSEILLRVVLGATDEGLAATAYGLGKEKETVDKGLAYARVKPRARMLALYYVAEQENRLVAGTTNRSEAIRGLRPRSGVTAPPTSSPSCREIIRKAPSPDVLPGIVGKAALGIDYETLDRNLDGLERGLDAAHVAVMRGASHAQVRDVQELVRRSRHLRELPPCPVLGGVGLTKYGDFGRRLGQLACPGGQCASTVAERLREGVPRIEGSADLRATLRPRSPVDCQSRVLSLDGANSKPIRAWGSRIFSLHSDPRVHRAAAYPTRGVVVVELGAV